MAEIPDIKLILPQGDSCIIRVARESDSTALVEYLNRTRGETSFLPSGADESDLSPQNEEKFIARMGAAENSLFLVAEVRNRIAGVLTLEGNSRPRMKHVAELGISVLKEYWRQGIGRAFMEIALAWAESNPMLRKVFLVVHHENQRAIDLYSRLGFVQEGVQSKVLHIEGEYHDCLYMARAV
jgi:RimJ/RimL family protein N-acetyltransferase